ncbi:MAG: hypothetical protein JXR77_17145 [Lentisphaeria bacterium]|nr:hypothetical protein [Lentisphaeria bacterium]
MVVESGVRGAFFRKLPNDDHRIYLLRHPNSDGLLPHWVTPEVRIGLRYLLIGHCRPIWWSAAFYMPSLAWRSEHPRSGQDGVLPRWAVGILVCEREGADPGFPCWEASGGTRGLDGFGQPLDPGRPSRFLGLVQLDPSILPTLGTRDVPSSDQLVVEAHLKVPRFARRGVWHAVENNAGRHYALSPFRGMSLFFQRGLWADCAFVACRSAIMITQHSVGGRPYGVAELVGNLIAAFLMLPVVRGLSLWKRLVYGRALQRWLETRASEGTPPKAFGRLVRGLIRRDPAFPSVIELIAMALRLQRSGEPGCGGTDTVPADFNCSAVLESLPSYGDHLSDGERESMRQVFFDYVSAGFPVVCPVAPKELPEYEALVQSRLAEFRREAGLEPPSPCQAVGGGDSEDHAFLLLGYHLARPCEVPAGVATYGRSVDGFVVSDLTYTQWLNVDPDRFCDATARSTRLGRGDERKLVRQFLVVVPKGVLLSAWDARELTRAWLSKVAPWSSCASGLVTPEDLDDPIRCVCRTVLLTIDRARQRFATVIREDCKGTWDSHWKRLARGFAAENSEDRPPGYPETKILRIWEVQVHAAVRDVQGEVPRQGPHWVPHQALMTFQWRADEELGRLALPAGRQASCFRPLLVAVHPARRLLLYPPCAGESRERPNEVPWDEHSFPSLV